MSIFFPYPTKKTQRRNGTLKCVTAYRVILTLEIQKGGGSRFAYPKWVWSWYGGWWAQPANAKSNAAIAAGIWATAVAATWTISANKEVPVWSKGYGQG